MGIFHWQIQNPTKIPVQDLYSTSLKTWTLWFWTPLLTFWQFQDWLSPLKDNKHIKILNPKSSLKSKDVQWWITLEAHDWNGICISVPVTHVLPKPFRYFLEGSIKEKQNLTSRKVNSLQPNYLQINLQTLCEKVQGTCIAREREDEAWMGRALPGWSGTAPASVAVSVNWAAWRLPAKPTVRLSQSFLPVSLIFG